MGSARLRLNGTAQKSPLVILNTSLASQNKQRLHIANFILLIFSSSFGMNVSQTCQEALNNTFDTRPDKPLPPSLTSSSLIPSHWPIVHLSPETPSPYTRNTGLPPTAQMFRSVPTIQLTFSGAPPLNGELVSSVPRHLLPTKRSYKLKWPRSNKTSQPVTKNPADQAILAIGSAYTSPQEHHNGANAGVPSTLAMTRGPSRLQ